MRKQEGPGKAEPHQSQKLSQEKRWGKKTSLVGGKTKDEI